MVCPGPVQVQTLKGGWTGLLAPESPRTSLGKLLGSLRARSNGVGDWTDPPEGPGSEYFIWFILETVEVQARRGAGGVDLRPSGRLPPLLFHPRKKCRKDLTILALVEGDQAA